LKIQCDKYIENCLKIKTKGGEIVPFKLNVPQRRLYEVIKQQDSEGKPIRVIVLKARQEGISTGTGGVIFQKTATKKNVKAAIVSHKDTSSTSILEMYKLFYRHLPEPLKPQVQASNAKELIFDSKDGNGLNSRIRCYTAGSEDIGRSETFQYMHISEYAFWGKNKEDVLLGLLQAVPDRRGTIVIIESTANGFDDFRERWYAAVRGESDYYPLFIGWNELSEYRKPFNEKEPLTAEEVTLKEQYGLDNEQIQFRRDKIRNECGGDINKFKQEYPICPDEAFIATGNTYFDKAAVIARIQEIEACKIEFKRGEFEYEKDDRGMVIDDSIRFVASEKGFIKIIREPEERKPYVIGGDTAGEGSDCSVGEVLDNTNGMQVAELHARNIDEDLYTEQMYCLGRYYNTALIGIEANFSTFHNRRLQELEYPKIYMREREDAITRSIKMQYGFRTDRITRNRILAGLKIVFRDYPELINDKEVLREALTFVVNTQGRAEAMQGENDDRIMALAIAHDIREQQDSKVEIPNSKKVKYEWWQLEDLRNARTPEERRAIIEEYGEPLL
jgi:hypothetical protein